MNRSQSPLCRLSEHSHASTPQAARRGLHVCPGICLAAVAPRLATSECCHHICVLTDPTREQRTRRPHELRHTPRVRLRYAASVLLHTRSAMPVMLARYVRTVCSPHVQGGGERRLHRPPQRIGHGSAHRQLKRAVAYLLAVIRRPSGI